MKEYSVKIVSGANGIERFTVEAEDLIDALGEVAVKLEALSEDEKRDPGYFQVEVVAMN